MNQPLLRYCAALLLGLDLFSIGPAHASIICTNISISNVVFGSVDPQSSQTDATATLTYTCTNLGIILPPTRSATLCLSIGEPGGGSMNPRQMHDTASNTLGFQLYQDPARSIIWGSQFFGSATPLMANITLTGGLLLSGESTTYTNTIYGRVMPAQPTVVPGSYTENYTTADTAITINQTIGHTAPGTCSGSPSESLDSFIVSANVLNKCTVTASPLNFGNSVGVLTSEVVATTTLGAQCSNTTLYNVGLDAGQNSGGDINARKMTLGANSIGYQLYQDPARTVVWGNTVGTNTVSGTGSGNTQNLTVYGKVPAQLTPPAGTYTDVIVVTVTY
jgi:spore coat protein U-like protein